MNDPSLDAPGTPPATLVQPGHETPPAFRGQWLDDLRVEQINLMRAEALAELVRRRGKPAAVVLEEIGWEAGADGR